MPLLASRRVSTARASNGEAAAAGLWQALDTAQCGHPEIVSDFFTTVEPGGRIVDLGCWNGSIAGLAAACIDGGDVPWESYVGIDVVPAALGRFKALHTGRPRTIAVAGDVRVLPLPDDCADVILCLFVLQDMEGYRADGLQALGEIARIARPGARLLIGLTVHALHEENTHYVVKKLRKERIPEKPTHHWHGPEFLAAVRAKGFRVTHLDGFGPNDRGFVELYVRAAAGGHPEHDGTAVPVGLLPAAPPLHVDYVDHFERVAQLYPHDFRDPASFERAAVTAAARELPRDAVSGVLRDQHAVFAAGDAAWRNIERLRRRETVAVVTGQQPALFGGPLYTLYKAATAVQLARHLEAATGRPHVPVFWIANDDHMLAAVDHVHAVADDGLVRIAWDHGRQHTTEPISEVRLDEDVDRAIDVLRRTTGSPGAELAAATFRAGERLSDCFGRFLAASFERDGLVVVDPSDVRLRRLGMPRLASELDFPSPSALAARTATEWLAAQGYRAQVALRDDRLGLFYGHGQRFRIRASESGCQIGPDAAATTWDAVRAMHAAAPHDFSPNVLLRPLYQDALFPTAAYVAGPGEIAYFAQLGPVYARFGLPMPVIYPRKTVTVLNSRARHELDAAGLGVADIFREVTALGSDAFASTGCRWLHAYLAPRGEPQERVVGAACIPTADVIANMSLDVFDHQLIPTSDGA
jgi:bacillithiol biosynthesis cysteine-adding enzyme BshC